MEKEGIYECKSGRVFDLRNIEPNRWNQEEGKELIKSVGSIIGTVGTYLPDFHDEIKNVIESGVKVYNPKSFWIKKVIEHLEKCEKKFPL